MHTRDRELVKTLRDSQAVNEELLFRAARRGVRDLVLHAPAASGKTITLKSFMARMMVYGDVHTVVINAPLDQVVEAWRKPEIVAARPAANVLTFQAAPGVWDGTPAKDLPMVEKLTGDRASDPSFWARTKRSAPLVLVCNRALLTTKRVRAAIAAAGSLKGYLFVGDEYHHHASGPEGNLAGEVYATLRARGAITVGASATPWNSSGEVIREDTTRVLLALVDYLNECDEDGNPYAPQKLECLPVLLKFKTDDETLAVDDDRRADDLPAQMEREVPLSFEQEWVAGGCRKTVMICNSRRQAEALVKKLRASKVAAKVLGHAPQVLDLVGKDGVVDRAEIAEVLRSEAEVKSYEDSRVDVIIAVRRMDEGTDWPLCSDVYCVGITGSISLKIQRWFRAGRSKLKIKGYPSHSSNVMRLREFIPRLTDEARDRLLERHEDMVLGTALFLTNLAAARETFHQTSSCRGPRKPTFDLDKACIEAEHGTEWKGDSVQNSLAFAKVAKLMARSKEPLDVERVADLVDRVAAKLPVDQRLALIRGAMEHLQQNPELEEAWKAAERGSVYRVSRLARLVPGVVRQELEEAWVRFKAEHARKVCPPIERALEQCAVLTASTVEELGRAWQGAVSRYYWPKELAELFVLAKEHGQRHYDTHGKWPTGETGAIEGLPSVTWGALAAELYRRGSGLHVVFGRDKDRSALNAKQIAAFVAKTGNRPSSVSDDKDERRLAGALQHIYRMRPELVEYYSLPPHLSRAEAAAHGFKRRDLKAAKEHLKRARSARYAATKPYATTGQLVTHLAVAFPFRLTDQAPQIGNGKAVNSALTQGCRGLGETTDRCQTTTLARVNAEIEADCWHFTLAGQRKPDRRPWDAILTAGDNVKIEKAVRVAFLDWANPGPDGEPVRRVWSDPT